MWCVYDEVRAIGGMITRDLMWRGTTMLALRVHDKVLDIRMHDKRAYKKGLAVRVCKLKIVISNTCKMVSCVLK